MKCKRVSENADLASQEVRTTVPDRVPEAGKIDHYHLADVFVEPGKQAVGFVCPEENGLWNTRGRQQLGWQL